MRDVTPKDMRCTLGGCPALYEQQDGHIIIGKVMETVPPELLGRIGPDEMAVWVPKGLVQPAASADEARCDHPVAEEGA